MSTSLFALMPHDRVLLDGQTACSVVRWGRGGDGSIVYCIQLDDGSLVSGVAARRLALVE